MVGLDIQDENGRHEVGFVDNTLKTELFGGQGCLFTSRFLINKVPGNFHVSTHAAKTQPQNVDMSHVVHELTFGDVMDDLMAEDITFNALRATDRSDAKRKS